MPESPLQAAGAQIEPSAAAPLHTNEFFTGMMSQANPLGPGPVPYLYQKFYSASRYDRLDGGLNTELTPRLTLGRRAGFNVLNAAVNFAAKRFYFFRGFTGSAQNNRLLADLGNTVSDVTPPTGLTTLFNKSNNADRAAFQSVGNTCYIADGIDYKKYMLAGKTWQANTVFQLGDIILDSNNKLQVATSTFKLNIIGVFVYFDSGSGHWFAQVTLDRPTSITVGQNVTFQNLSGYVALNGVAVNTVAGGNTNQIVVQVTGGQPYGPTEDTGTVVLTSLIGVTQGQSGGAPPVWAAGYLATTADNDLVWTNYGPSVYEWSCAPPTIPPTMAANAANRQWQANLPLVNGGGSPLYFSILDSNNNVELITVPPAGAVQLGPTVPIWSQIFPTTLTPNPGQTIDGTAIWQNLGPIGQWQPSTTVLLSTVVRDTNGYLQMVSVAGATGGAAPTWNATVGGTTVDGAVTWINIGSGIILLTDTRKYFIAYHTISGHVTCVSPSVTLNPDGNLLGLQGAALATLSGFAPAAPNLDVDAVWIFCTAQGGSQPLFLQSIPTPGPGGAWTFVDNFPDAFLSPLIIGPQNNKNDPPPVGFMPIAYHLGLLCGFKANVLMYSNGTAAVGNPNEGYPPLNNFPLPSAIVGGWSTSIGLIILRVDGISIMLGSNTAASPLYVVNLFDGVGLASRDGFTTRGNSIFMVTTTSKVLRLDTAQFISAIQGGVNQTLPDDEIGFPIGDLLGAFNPATTYIAWLEGPSADSGLFVMDTTAAGWYMMRLLQQPEQATPWSPFGQLAESAPSAIAAIQTAPGVNSLIMGTITGPIWKRDTSTNLDHTTPYVAYADVAPIVLAQPGSTVSVQFITTEEKKIAGATPLAASLLPDEISGTNFSLLKTATNDPPNLPRPTTVEVQRFWASQDASPIQVCRYIKERIAWPAENYPNELLTNTIFGRLPTKARK